MLDLQVFIKTFSYFGIFAAVFAESGLLIGFFLPGDSLLFVAGFLASKHLLSLATLIPVVFVAAVLGDSVGYAIGHRAGDSLFSRPKSHFFHPEQIERTQKFFDKHGGKTIILSRFVPVVRTFTPVLAGVGKMRYRKFFSFNLIGALVWAGGVSLLGYFLGKTIPNIDHYLLPIIAIIIAASLVPSAWHFAHNRKSAS